MEVHQHLKANKGERTTHSSNTTTDYQPYFMKILISFQIWITKLDIMKMLRLFSGLPNTGSQIFTLHCIFSHFIFFSNKKVAASSSTYKGRLCSEQKQPPCSQLTKHHLISISPVWLMMINSFCPHRQTFQLKK